MTFGEFLRACRKLAGSETKSDFARRLGLKDPDHYIGAENDTLGKRPSIDLLEAAAQLAGFSFHDCIVLPGKHHEPLTKDHQQLHRLLQEILDLNDDEAAPWISGNIRTFHRAYIRGGKGKRRR